MSVIAFATLKVGVDKAPLLVNQVRAQARRKLNVPQAKENIRRCGSYGNYIANQEIETSLC